VADAEYPGMPANMKRPSLQVSRHVPRTGDLHMCRCCWRVPIVPPRIVLPPSWTSFKACVPHALPCFPLHRCAGEH
jgi:hypothetical protein